MEKYKNIQLDIEHVTNQEVIKKTRVSGVAMALLAMGILCFVFAKGFEDPNSSIPTFLYTASVFLLLSGIIKLFVHRSCYFFRPTQSRLKSVTLYFDVHESEMLQDCIERKRFDELNRLKREKDTGVKLEAMVAADGKFAAVQVSEYIPYTYEAITPVRCYYGEEAQKLVAVL